ncbi:MAG: hypothetical protein GY751_14510 [Bacteroidetes bacterium]|nr:hypothetical protein [Bacteroidota bacterium]
MKLYSLSLLVLTFLLLSCKSDIQEHASTVNLLSKRGKLISAEFINTIRATDINSFFPEAEELEGDISNLPYRDIDLYRVIYSSIFKNEIIELSGLIVIPKSDEPLSHIQYHHGTMLPYPYPHGEGSLDAPSLYNGEKVKEKDSQYETRLFGNYLASYGYLVSLPDYVGYGNTSEYEHCYSVNNRLAEQSVDLILATREFCRNNQISLNEKLFLSGWSEGGAACVATQKLIESEYQNSITITANAPLAGFYNVSHYARKFITFLPFIRQDFKEDLDVLIWALYSINEYSDGSPVPKEKIFKYEVNNQLDVLKNRPTSRPAKVFKFKIGKNRKNLIAKFDQNSLAKNWTPLAPIYIHHGTDDDIVYYDKNVEVVIKNLNRNGGSTYLRKYDNHDHYSLALLYLTNMIADFETH